MAAADFIPQTDPYSTPANFKATTTPGGGSAYDDGSGNVYTRTASGFQLFKPPAAPNSGLTQAANNAPTPTIPAPSVITSQPAKDGVATAQQGLQGELARIALKGQVPEGGTVVVGGQTYTRQPDGSFAIASGQSSPANTDVPNTSPNANPQQNNAPQGGTGGVGGGGTPGANGLKPNQYGFYRDPSTGAVTYYDAQGNTYGTNPSGGDQYINNPEEDPGFKNGTLVKLAQPPQPASTSGLQSTGNPEIDKAVSDYTSKINQFNSDAADTNAKLNAISANLDTANANLIESIKASYASSIAATNKLNQATLAGLTQAGIRSGRNMYAPEIENGYITEEVNNGIQRITDLQNQRDQLIAQAQLANTKEQYDELYKTWGLAQKNFEDQGTAVMDLYQKTIDFQKQAQANATAGLANLKTQQDLSKGTIDSISSLALASMSGDVTKDGQTIQALAAQYGVDPNQLMSAVQALNDKNAKYTGDVGSYQFYSDQERAAGRTPVDYLTFLEQQGAAKAGTLPPSSTGGGNGVGASGNSNPQGKIVNGYDLNTYATDPQYGIKVDAALNALPTISNATQADAYIKSVAPNSPITGDMVMNAAMKYNVDPQVLMAMMKVESQFGTTGAAVGTQNVGNIGNTDDGSTQKMASWQVGVDTMAANLAGRRTIAANPDDQGLIDQLTPTAKGLLPGILNYTVDPTKATNLRTQDRAKVIAAAKAIDPSYDERQFQARSDLIKDWTSGNTRTAINSMNTVTGHLASLADSIAELNNGAIPGINWATNTIGNLTGNASVQKGLTDFNTTADAVVSELSKIYKGTGSSDLTEIENMRKNIDANSSPTAQKAFIDKSAELMFSRLSALSDNYRAVMGTDPTIQILTPHSIAALNALGIDTSDVAQSSGGNTEQNVVVIAPDGSQGSVPASRLQEYLSHGYKQAS